MGNDNTYERVNNDDDKQQPIIKNFHRKGRPYGLLLDKKLNSSCPTTWSYWSIFDLRNGKGTWWLNSKSLGDELKFILYLTKTEKLFHDGVYLEYNSKSNDNMTILKGRNSEISVELELYVDNIHSQRIHDLKTTHKFFIYGFIKFNNQDKIKIALD
jgi:hypothetical protein